MIDVASDLDFFDQEQIEITKRIKDFREITLSQSEFSKEFSVPANAKNNAVFEFYANIDVDAGINPHVAIDAFWTVDQSTVFDGVLEVKGCSYKNGDPYSYSLVFYGKLRNLAAIFGDDTLKEIDWSSLNHNLTYANVDASWDKDLFGGDVLYPLVDFYRNFYFGPPDLNIPGNIRNASNGILLTDLKPAMRLNKMVELIFANYDLSVDGTINDADLDEIYVLPSANSGALIDYESYQQNKVSVSSPSSFTIPTDGSDQVILTTNEILDVNGNYNNTTNVFTTPITGAYTFQVVITATSGSFVNFTIGMKVNGTEVQSQNFSTSNNSLTANAFFSQQLTESDTVQFVIREFISISPLMTVAVALMTTVDFPTLPVSYTVNFAESMPDMKVSEFINGLLKTFRWLVLPGAEPNAWNMYSESDWRALGTERDWSKYLDLKDITYRKPTVYKQIRLTFAESESAVHTAFSEIANRRFGEINIRTGVDFGEDLLEVESIFTTWPETVWNVLDDTGEVVGATNIDFYKMLDIEGSAVQDKFLIFYNTGITPQCGYDYYLQNGQSGGDPTFFATQRYPLCKWHSSANNPNINTDTTTYAFEQPLIGDGVPQQTFFTKYWQDEIFNLYANGARVATAKFRLPMSEFLSYQLNDTIWAEGRRWYIDELTYNTKTGFAKAQLRSKEPLKSFATIDSIDIGGKVDFSSTPGPMEKSIANVGQEKSGSYYQLTPKSITLNNKLVYTQAETQIFQTYITNIINVINENILTWGDS